MMFREVKKCVLICQAPDPGLFPRIQLHRSSKPWTHVVPIERNLTPPRFLSPPVTPRCPGHSSQHPTLLSRKPQGDQPPPFLAFAPEASRPLCLRELLPPASLPAAGPTASHTGVSLPLPPPSGNLLNTPHAGGGTQWWRQQVSAASVEDVWGAGGVEPAPHDARNHLVWCQCCRLLSTFTCISVCAPANLLPKAWQVLPAHLPGEESRAHLCPVVTAGKRQGLQAPTQSTLSSRVSPGNHGVCSGSQPSAPRCWGGHLGRGGLCLLLTLEYCT